MAKVSFKLRKQKDGMSKIYVRLRSPGFDKLLRTPYIINPYEWSSKKQKMKENNNAYDSTNAKINAKLSRVKASLGKAYNDAISDSTPIDGGWFKKELDKCFINAPKEKSNNSYFNSYLKEYIDHENKRLAKKSKQLKQEFRIDPNIQKLNEIIDEDTRLSDIDSKWLERFEEDWTDKGYSVSYLRKKIQLIRRVLNHAKAKYNLTQDYDQYILPETAPNYDVYLNEEELQLLFDKDFDTDRLNNVKKLFLISATSGGLRVSDLMKIKDNLRDGDIIDIDKIIKTKRPLSILLDPRVRGYVDEIKPISDQKYNEYIKEMLELVGISNLVEGHVRGKGNKKIHGIYPKYRVCSSHTARRSFASNYFGVLKLEDLMMILGHSSPKQTIEYVKKSSREHLESFKVALKEKYPEYYDQ